MYRDLISISSGFIFSSSQFSAENNKNNLKKEEGRWKLGFLIQITHLYSSMYKDLVLISNYGFIFSSQLKITKTTLRMEMATWFSNTDHSSLFIYV